MAQRSPTETRLVHGVLGLLLAPVAYVATGLLLAAVGGTLEFGRVRDTDGFVISAAGMLSLFLWLLSLRLVAGRTVRQGRVLAPREQRVAACVLAYVGAVATYAYFLA